MIVTDHFVFVHMHKTGGQTINRLIEECMAKHEVVGYHYPVHAVPAEAAHLPVIGMVRNPWDWYVSWFAFNRRPGARNPLYYVVSDNGAADFRTTITNLVELGSPGTAAESRRQALRELLPETLGGKRGAGLTQSCMDELAASGRGYLSWLVQRMLEGNHGGEKLIGRFENLRADLATFLRGLNVPEAAAIEARFDSNERRNVSRHSHYSHYYDDELRERIATRDAAFIAAYGYEFESVKPQGVAYECNEADAGQGTPAFQKLFGRSASFLRLNDEIDTDPLRRKVEQIDEAQWAASDRNRLFKVHSNTQSLALVTFEDYKQERPEYLDLYSEFHEELAPVLDYIAAYYSDNGFVVRALLAKLAAGGEIPRHTDAGYSLLNTHRIHLPIITNQDVDFHVGDETLQMRAGELWEINNATMHGVRNRGTADRVHLIIDWMPNYRGEPISQVLQADDLEAGDSALANEQMLASLINQARQLQRGGQAARAEAIYRQILHFDPDHVVAGNLLGLLCLQSQRAGEAIPLIEHALELSPGDAQAHANLGLALSACGRHDEAVGQLRQSLQLAPGNLRVLNNLGSLLLLLGRADEAVRHFRAALNLEPGHAQVHFNLGSALTELQNYDEAAASLEHCLALKPDFAEARNRLHKLQQILQAK